MTPEGRVKAIVSRALARVGTELWRFMPVQMGLGATALDYLVCLRGRFLAIETKANRGRVTPRQLATAQQITAAGGLVIFVVGDEGAKVFAGRVLPALVQGVSDERVPWSDKCWRFLQTS
jgi:hypothetical protein